MEKAKEKGIGKHTNHWIQELYCQDCRKKLADDEIFNKGYNWAVSELKPLANLAQQVLDAKMPEEKEETPVLGEYVAGKEYNQALHDFRLWQQKCLGKLEEVIIKSKLHQLASENKKLKVGNDIGGIELASAIRNLFGGGE